MKKHLICIIILCLTMIISCGGSSSDDGNNAPEITEFEFRLDPFGDEIPSSFNVDDNILMTFLVKDKDKDLYSYCLTIKNATTLAIVLPETEYLLELEGADEIEYLYTPVDSSTSGTFTYEFYVKDKAGNKSETIKKNLIIK